jgi:protein-S-isoprenylcysteine O-methyltransferase Ste14
MKHFPDAPPVWALGMILLSGLLARYAPLAGFRVPIWLPVALIAAGFALMIWTAVRFRRKATPIMPREAPTALIADGPFRINRNPIYTGMTLVILGAALWFGGLSGLLPVAAFPVIVTRRFILGEEAGLRRAFGPAAEEFFRRTRRW